MKKLMVLLAILVLALFGRVFAEDGVMVLEQNTTAAGVSPIPVASTDTVYTHSFSLKRTEKMATMYKATTSVGSISLNISLLQSYVEPTTEGTYDVRYDNTVTLVTTLSDANWHIATFDTLTSLPYGVYIIKGTGSNSALTTITIETCKQ